MADIDKTKEELVKELESLREEISNNKETMVTLEQQQKKISNILSCVSVGIMVVDAKKKIITVANPALLALIGASEEFVLGKKKKEFLPDKHNGSEQVLIDANGDSVPVLTSISDIEFHGQDSSIISCIDITALKQMEKKQEALISELQTALADVKALGGLIPMCCKCHKIRNDKNYWETVECYIEGHSEATFTHGYCQECTDELLAEIENTPAEILRKKPD